MPEYRSAAIANAFIDLAERPLPQMMLHKLTYMANGWHLAITGEPLVSDKPEAWDNGPVFRLIWDRIRDFGTDKNGKILKSSGKPFAADLSAEEQSVIEHVWRKYKKFSQFALSDMTHQPGTPWTQTYFSRGRNAVIEDDLVREHYVQLARANRG